MWTPYIGGGVGLALVSAGNIGAQANGSAVNEKNVPQFAWQGIAGIAAQLDHNWAVTADYRYIAAVDPSLKLVSGGVSDTNGCQPQHHAGIALQLW